MVALADKIDTLAGFWMIDEKPTGSKDPYALRRAALGVIRIVLEREAHVPLLPVFEKALAMHGQAEGDRRPCAQGLLDFLVERLRVYLRERGVRHDVVSAVFARGSDDIVDIVGKAKYLADFLQTPDGSNLLAAYRRADGILQQQKMAANSVSADLFEQDAEGTLFAALSDLPDTLDASLQAYGQYLDELSALRISVDGFFDAVLVNAEDDKLSEQAGDSGGSCCVDGLGRGSGGHRKRADMGKTDWRVYQFGNGAAEGDASMSDSARWQGCKSC